MSLLIVLTMIQVIRVRVSREKLSLRSRDRSVAGLWSGCLVVGANFVITGTVFRSVSAVPALTP